MVAASEMGADICVRRKSSTERALARFLSREKTKREQCPAFAFDGCIITISWTCFFGRCSCWHHRPPAVRRQFNAKLRGHSFLSWSFGWAGKVLLEALGKESPATGVPDAGPCTISLASVSVVKAVWPSALPVRRRVDSQRQTCQFGGLRPPRRRPSALR